MTSLTPQSRAIINAARPGEELADGDRDRIKGELMVKIAAGAAVAGAVAGGTVKAAAATKTATQAAGTAAGGGVLSLVGGAGSLGALTKGGLALLLVGSLGLGAHQLLTEPSAAPQAPIEASATTEAEPERAGEALPAATPQPATAAPAEGDDAKAAEEASEEPVVPAPAERAEPSAGEPATGPAASSLAAETSLLQQAQSELQAGDPDRALELLERHGSEHSAGALREERQAARVLALCAAGRGAEARAEAQRFVADYPRSPQRARVLAACSEE